MVSGLVELEGLIMGNKAERREQRRIKRTMFKNEIAPQLAEDEFRQKRINNKKIYDKQNRKEQIYDE